MGIIKDVYLNRVKEAQLIDRVARGSRQVGHRAAQRLANQPVQCSGAVCPCGVGIERQAPHLTLAERDGVALDARFLDLVLLHLD